jgi:putative nucleotidyltransferase with HDIG domain
VSRLARWLDGLVRLLGRLGLDEVRLTTDDLRRLFLLVATCLACAVLVVDWERAPSDALSVGDVAPRTVKAPHKFQFADHASQEEARALAAAAVPEVYQHRADLADDLVARISAAFEAGRVILDEPVEPEPEPEAADGAAPPVDPEEPPAKPPLTEATVERIHRAFEDALEVAVPKADVAALVRADLPATARSLASDLLRHAMQNRIVTNRSLLPQDQRPVHIIEIRGSDIIEHAAEETRSILTPSEAREKVSLGVLERSDRAAQALTPAQIDAASTVARSLVRPNLQFDPLKTEEQRAEAAAAVPVTLVTVKRGEILFREGDSLSQRQEAAYRTLQASQGTDDLVFEIMAVALFLALLFVVLYQFGSLYLGSFSTAPRDVGTVGILLVLVVVLARMVVASSDGIAALIGYEAEARSVWFLVPLAGPSMLLRLLLGVPWTAMFAVAAAVLTGLVMDLDALPMTFALLSCIVAASAVDHTRERIAVLRAGLQVGLFNAACVLVFHFLQLFVVDTEVSLATTMRPVWSMSFAFAGGMLSSFFVLGAMPIFESAGFVTDYRLMELANLNHPLLRQLMLRAPGTYHHSVVVGTLAEAACEAIGANALRAKVSAYFHDIGKTLNPEYFVENQQGGRNRHDGLDPRASAQIIIAHVLDGGRMAREHKLPKPILDIIYMHHGTGILQYFYDLALRQAAEPDLVDERDYRYQGPKPDTREAGVVMLADKVEAATRTIAQPTERNIRLMISRIVNSVMADGQFSECPLTFEEIHTIHETFVRVLIGIYHQRIEYPSTTDITAPTTDADADAEPKKRRRPEPPPHATITLEIEQERKQVHQRPHLEMIDAPEPKPDEPVEDEVTDYEAVKHLPAGER